MQRCTLIFNEAAGTAEHDELEQVRSCLSRFDFEARPVREGQDPREQARAALAERGGIIVAFGGDGTVLRAFRRPCLTERFPRRAVGDGTVVT